VQRAAAPQEIERLRGEFDALKNDSFAVAKHTLDWM